MHTLLTFPPAFGSVSASGFSTKAIILMQMSGLDWRRETLNDPRKMPHGKLPVLVLPDGRQIADSENIRHWLEEQGVDMFPGCGARDRAMGQALVRMGDEHLYFFGMADRWHNDDVWPVVRDQMFKEVPKILRGIVAGSLRKGAIKGMHQQGIGRFSDAERLSRIEPDLRAIATLLDPGPFLFGSELTVADASVGAMLAGLMATPVETALVRRIKGDAVLSAYANRVEARARDAGT